MIRFKNFDIRKITFEESCNIGKEEYDRWFLCPADLLEIDQSDDIIANNTEYFSSCKLAGYSICVAYPYDTKYYTVRISPCFELEEENAVTDVDWYPFDMTDSTRNTLIKKANDDEITRLIRRMCEGEFAILKPSYNAFDIISFYKKTAADNISDNKELLPLHVKPCYYIPVCLEQTFCGYDGKILADAEVERILRAVCQNYVIAYTDRVPVYQDNAVSDGDVILFKNGNVSAFFFSQNRLFKIPLEYVMEDFFGYIRQPLIEKKKGLSLKKEDGSFNVPTLWGSTGLSYFSGEASFDECCFKLRLANLIDICDDRDYVLSQMAFSLREYGRSLYTLYRGK